MMVRKKIILSGILRSSDCVHLVMNGVPCLLVEACIDDQEFLGCHIIHFAEANNTFATKYSGLNKQSFAGYGA
jgi:hypothetical protein